MREDDMAFDYYRPGGFHSLQGVGRQAGKLVRLAEPLHHVLDGRQDAGDLRQHRQGRVSGERAREPAHAAVADLVEDSDRAVARAGQQRDRVRVQSFLHECAVAAKRDHLEFLVEVMGEPRQLPPDPFGGVFNTGRAVDVIKAVAERSGWGRKMPAGRALGLAFHFSHPGHFAEVADVSVDANKKVTCTRSGSWPTSARS